MLTSILLFAIVHLHWIGMGRAPDPGCNTDMLGV